ncbi:methionyl-tRNA formyltransferase [Kouleothrix aurantiaca]|uniref:Methionyl-tRNA formyltransferase n=1 Tax=Kouleothrix aurantiaca TaxID=186479 RepID=A0A0P9DAN6_9CHLR|nr:methionyl-tRNA formyltransferase [Kouleothrix aurantiaca]
MDGPISPEALYAQLLETWNQRDAASYGALFAADGNVVGFDGSQIDGSAAIAAEIGRIFANHQTARYVGKVREVRLIAPGVALLRAVVGMVPPGQNSINPAVNAIQSLVAVRDAGAWRAALFHNTPAQFHGRPELAEQLTEELSEELLKKDSET